MAVLIIFGALLMDLFLMCMFIFSIMVVVDFIADLATRFSRWLTNKVKRIRAPVFRLVS